MRSDAGADVPMPISPSSSIYNASVAERLRKRKSGVYAAALLCVSESIAVGAVMNL